MTKTVEATAPILSVRERIIVALDVASADEAREIVSELKGQVGAFKIGLQMYMAAGPAFVRELVQSSEKVFLDLKFHDIPNTVAKAAVEAARLGVWMFNVHAAGGGEMMRAAVDAVTQVCSKEGLTRPLIIGVTALTSSDSTVLRETGVAGDTLHQVERLAKLCSSNRLDGVVASAQEAAVIRNGISDRKFLIVTPGIRPKDATSDDQKRVTTLEQAIAAGSDYAVIGRPITGAKDRAGAVDALIAGIEGN